MANLFADGFESGNTTAWGNVIVSGGGTATATSEAKIEGDYGLSCALNNSSTLIFRKSTIASESRYRVGFFIDPNSVTIDTDLSFFRTFTSGYGVVYYTELIITNGKYGIYINVKNDDGNDVGTVVHYITDAPHYLEFDWKASSAPGANDGFFSLWIDGTFRETVSRIDNDTKTVGIFDFGVMDAGLSTGTLYLDSFASNNDGVAIGTIVASPPPGFQELGMGLASSSDNTSPYELAPNFGNWVDELLKYGFRKLRIDIVYFDSPTAVAVSKSAVLLAISKGAQVIWGYGAGATTLTATNWPNYRAAILVAAAWAQNNGVYEFQLGNEEEWHVDDTTLTVAQLITNLKSVATDVQAIFTRGNVSYAIANSYIFDWVVAGRGDIDIITSNVYMGNTTFTNAWKTQITNLINGFGVDHTYLTEFAPSSVSLASYSTNDVVQADGVAEMLTYFKASGMKRAIFFDYYDDARPFGLAGFGVLKTDGTHRRLWDKLKIKRPPASRSTVSRSVVGTRVSVSRSAV